MRTRRGLASRPRALLAVFSLLAASACDDGAGPADGDVDGWPDGDADGDIDAEGDADEDSLDPDVDSDGDGLPDLWELSADAPAILDPGRTDTDGDGTPDGDEDPDGDGLTNLDELALGRLEASPPGAAPDPLRLDLPVELDAMAGHALSDAVLAVVAGAYRAAAVTSDAGAPGIGVLFYRDQESIATADAGGSFEARTGLLSSHGPAFGDAAAPAIPYGRMAHVMVVTRRRDDPTRGGEVVGVDSGDPEDTGVLVYSAALADLHPACEVPDDPTRPAITLEEALAGTLTHELGHALQLGHDTEAGGGINLWNIMSVPSSCPEAHQRFHGHGNHDPTLGNTEEVMAPRFSAAAAALIRLDRVLSVHTSLLDDSGDGYEM